MGSPFNQGQFDGDHWSLWVAFKGGPASVLPGKLLLPCPPPPPQEPLPSSAA